MHTIPSNTSGQKSSEQAILTIESRLHKMQQTLPLPAFSPAQREAQHRAQRVHVRDLWFMATLLSACILSIAACFHFFQQHQILLYIDAYSHIRIARSVIDSTNPGIAQLGTVWLPLPHVFMLPFIWNMYLWRTGLAGSIVSMICYVITALYLYLSARRLTNRRILSYLGALVFLLNPNILYLQSTPLSELVGICTMTMTCYYFLSWVQEERPKLLILCAACTFLATLARYESWILLLALCVLIVVIGWQKHHSWSQIRGNLVLFGVFAAFGIALWLLWNQVIFGNALAFQNGPYSAKAAQLEFLRAGTLYTYHNWWLSVKTYTLTVTETVGPLLFALAALALLLFCIQERCSPVALTMLVFLSIFGFEVLSLYTGQTVIWLPGVLKDTGMKLFNVRYGTEMVVPVALLLTILVNNGCRLLHKRWHALIQIVFTIAVTIQTVLIVTHGIITLQDGLYGLSCTPSHPLNMYLAQHYAGGKILQDVTAGDYNLVDTGIDLKNVIYNGSADLWQQALAHPETTVEWVIDPNKNPIHQHVESPTFKRQFTLVVQEPGGLRLYHHIGRPQLPSRTVSNDMLTDHRLCH